MVIKFIWRCAKFFMRFFVLMLVLALLDMTWKHFAPAMHDSRAGQVAARGLINLAILLYVFRAHRALPLMKRIASRIASRKNAATGAVACVLCLCMAGCYDPNAQRSGIVREVEAAGSGNISTYSVIGLSEWFSHRPDLAKKIAYECTPIRQAAGANWATSAEGTVCISAEREVPPPAFVSDGRGW